jgi:DNA-binding response OmpR family regulator
MPPSNPPRRLRRRPGGGWAAGVGLAWGGRTLLFNPSRRRSRLGDGVVRLVRVDGVLASAGAEGLLGWMGGGLNGRSEGGGSEQGMNTGEWWLTGTAPQWSVGRHMSRRVLIVDDEPRVREVVATYLTREGFETRQAADAEAAGRFLDDFKPDLVVLDVMFPGASGMDLLAGIRRGGSEIPVILLTARAEEEDRVAGLELGADDYLVKPFSPRELVARVKSVLRRSHPTPASDHLAFEGLDIDPAAREVLVDGRTVELTAREFELLSFLASSPRQVFSRADLLDRVWDSSADWQDPATVTVHVRRIRQKIERDPHDPRWITTVWGVGYRFEP